MKISKIINKKKEEKETEIVGNVREKPTFLILSEYGELLDLAIWLDKVERYKTYFCVLEKDYKSIGKGIVETIDDWYECLGEGYVWVVDGCSNAKLQDWLREMGESVVGTNQTMSDHENDRQLGQAWFKKAGFFQPFSQNFKDIDSALEFIKGHKGQKLILKQNADLPKFLNHKAKFDGGEDMIFHLEELKKSWNPVWGEFDCDLMEVVEGDELAASAFFNGHDWLRNKEGKVVGFINMERKKQLNGNLGSTTGEMGTVFKGVDEDDELFSEIILKPEITKKLKESNYRGVFDINCIRTEKGIVALEATSRFGVPATSYEFTEGILSGSGGLLAAMAYGDDVPVEVDMTWGIAQVIVVPPFPVEADLEDRATSYGEKLWIMQDGKPAKEFSKDQLQHIHLENFEKKDEDYRVATKNGYLLVVTQKAKTIEEACEKSNEYIKDNLFITDMGYRTDLGDNIPKDLL